MKFKIIDDYSILGSPKKLPSEVIDYGVKMVGAPLEWQETEGENIKVGIIDTGIDLDHEDLKDRVKDYYSFVASESKNVFDDNGHGTHVAGIISANRNGIGVVGVAPKCDLYIAKAFDANGEAQTKNVVSALDWLLSKKVNVVNMSFNIKEYVSDFNILIKRCYDQGILCICAAGNEGKGIDTISYPAKFPETISVTAIDINRNIADFSSTGERADIAAPGNKILSTYPNSTYITLSGTSMAAPIITGSVALLHAKAKNRFNRILKPDEVKFLLEMYTDDLGKKGKDNEYGYGVFSFGRLNINSDTKSMLGENKTIYQNSYIMPQNFNMFNNAFLLKLMGFRF